MATSRGVSFSFLVAGNPVHLRGLFVCLLGPFMNMTMLPACVLTPEFGHRGTVQTNEAFGLSCLFLTSTLVQDWGVKKKADNYAIFKPGVMN